MLRCVMESIDRGWKNENLSPHEDRKDSFQGALRDPKTRGTSWILGLRGKPH